MTIRDWEGIALIIGVGDIGKCMSNYLKTVSPKLDVIVCGRNLEIQNGIHLDLEDDADIVDEAEDTLTILDSYVEGLEIKNDKAMLAQLLKSLHEEALSIS